MSAGTVPTATGGLQEELRGPTERLRAQFLSLRARVRRQLALEAVAWTLGIAVAAFFATLLFDWLIRPEILVRRALGVAAIASLGYAVFVRAIRPLQADAAELTLARVVDRRRPGTSQQVAAVLQLPGLLAVESHTSPAMIRLAVLENAEQLSRIDFGSYLRRDRSAKYLAWLVVILAAPTVFAVEAPHFVRLWYQRWVLGLPLRWPQRNFLSLQGVAEDGRIKTPRGEPLVLRVDASPRFVQAEYGWKVAGRTDEFALPKDKEPTSVPPDQVRIDLRSAAGNHVRGTFTKLKDDLFQYEMPPVLESWTATLVGGDDWRGPIVIEPVDRPTLASARIKATSPWSKDPPTDVDALSGQQLFLQDTILELTLVAAVPLREASLKADVGSPPALTRVDDRTYRAKWKMQASQTFEAALVSNEDGLSSRPIYLTIGLLKDRPPRVSLQASGVGRRVTPTAHIPLTLRAQDDFGVASLALEASVITPTPTKPVTRMTPQLFPIEKDSAGKLPEQFEKQFEYTLRTLNPAVGESVAFKGVAVDNCAQGGQKGESRNFAFQIVQPDELYYEILTRQRAERQRFQGALNNSQTQNDALTKATTPEPIPGALRTSQVVDRELVQIANRLEASLVELRLNELGNPAALGLLETKVVAPMRQLHEDGMPNLRQALQNAAGNAAALPEARKAQKEVVDAMQKILEQMTQWEGFVDVVNQLRSIITLEDGVMKKTEEKKKKAVDDVFDQPEGGDAKKKKDDAKKSDK